MPRLPTIRVGVLDELARQVRHATPAVLRRQIERLDELASELEPERWYPAEWIIFRITSYRPDTGDLAPGVVLGRALLASLSALGEHLSEAAGLTPDDCPAWPGLDELAARWGVSRRTVERRRELGLVARRVRTGPSVARVVFRPEAVEAFERAHAARFHATPAPAPLTEDQTRRVLRLASRYRASLGWARTRVAERIAERLGRSPGAVRRVLLDHDARAAEPIFPPTPRLASRQDAVCARALRRGIDPARVAHRLGVTPAHVRRAAVRERARLLRTLELVGPTLPTFSRPDAREVLLAPEPVRTNPAEPAPTSLRELIESMRERHPPDPLAESARIIAYRFLIHEAARTVRACAGRNPPAELVDRAETDLRHAASLNASIVRAQLRVVIDAAEEALALRLDALRERDARRLVLGSITTAAREVARADPARLDPGRAGRIAGRVSVAVARFAQRARAGLHAKGEPASRASPRVPAGAVVPDWTRRVEPWQAWLEPDPRLRAHVRALPVTPYAAALSARFGWDARPPRTLAELARELGTTPVAAAKIEREATRRALNLARNTHL
ncbi:MAG: hypothetical protein EA378_06965 [Phycisphaerales bacterium]|nr:MAG: hypothetical protein EA378_06965 [Phycisphaerales bacterium]